MFTGIVEEIGRVSHIEQRAENRRITVTGEHTPKELKTGDKCGGERGCMLDGARYQAGICSAPIWRRKPGCALRSRGIHEVARLVNLELPMKADGRFGGHIVQGHVDGVGKLIEFERIAQSENWWLHIELPEEVERYTVYKGSISIEGISLTVTKLEKNRCTIAIIPHTVERTNLHSLKAGDPVNLEADLIAKYVEKMMRGDADESSPTVEDLVRQGFLNTGGRWIEIAAVRPSA